MPPTTSDTELLVQFRNPLTKEKAFTSIIKKYQEKLYWHVRRMVIDHEDRRFGGGEVVQRCPLGQIVH